MVFELKASDGKGCYSIESDNLSFIVKHYKQINPKKKGGTVRFELSNQKRFDTLDELLEWVLQKAVIHDGTARSIEEILEKQQDLLGRIEAIVVELKAPDEEVNR